MRTRYDQLSKAVLDRALGPMGHVAVQHEITGAVQAADIWFRPTPGREAARARLGLLGRMAEMPCMFEPFHATPSTSQVLDCMHKQLSLRGMLLREAARQPGIAAWPPALVPPLWILSAGRPERIMRGLEFKPMPGWPPGFLQAAPMLRTHLVVLRELPETRESLLLRLTGRGATYRRAIHELHALPDHAWESALGIPQLLLAYRIEIPQNSGEDDMSYTDELQAIYDEWEARTLREGREQGEKAGREQGEKAGQRKSLRRLYEARFGALPPAVQAALEATEDTGTLQQWIVPFATRSPEEIAALVRER